MRKISILLLALFCLNIGGCTLKSAPGVVYENVSQKGQVIKNIKVIWNGNHILGKSKSKFCGGLSQSNNLERDSDFFGPIHVEWENAKGKKLTKDFIFTKEQLPSMKNRHKPGLENDSYVNLLFTQDDVYLYTSDTPNLQQIRDDLFKKAGLTCQEYRDQQYIKKWGKDW